MHGMASIQALRNENTTQKPLDCLVKIKKPSPPPVTPEVEVPTEVSLSPEFHGLEKGIAIILLFCVRGMKSEK